MKHYVPHQTNGLCAGHIYTKCICVSKCWGQ